MSAPDDGRPGAPPSSNPDITGLPPTFAAFSPVTLSATTPSRSARRSTILVHQKTPLLLATPPQVTRALAYNHPFVVLLNELAGLLTWSTADPWQSFLLLSAFWVIVLYGDVVVRRAGPVVLGAALIAAMYGRRYSPLSNSGWGEPARQVNNATAKIPVLAGQPKDVKGNASDASSRARHQRAQSHATGGKHQKTLDEIVDTLKELTGRCNVLMDPLLEMTDFLSTQMTPTSATTKPALTAMFVRLLVITPFWIALTLPPWRIITTRRVVLVAGTLALSWHARVMRVSRTILWRSAAVRRLAAVITGLRFHRLVKGSCAPEKLGSDSTCEAKKVTSLQAADQCRTSSPVSAGVKFTFIVYENQRRWVGLGWTSSLFSYERPAWTDEHNNAASAKDDFELPDVEDGSQTRWQWAAGSRWRVDGVPDEHGPVDYDGDEGRNGWVYYDNKTGRRGQDGWAKWTRRRKWYRDAELVETDASNTGAARAVANGPATGLHTLHYSTAGEKMISPLQDEPPLAGLGRAAADDGGAKVADDGGAKVADDAASVHSTSSKSSWLPSFRRRRVDRPRPSMDKERPRPPSQALGEAVSEDAARLGVEVELELQKQGKDGGQWGIGDEARMNLE